MINGMAEVHKNNVLHRDLKPENIFIDKKEGMKATAKIGDFGLARMLIGNKFQDGSSESTAFYDGSSSPSFHSSTEFLSPEKGINSKISVLSSVAGTEAYMAPEVKKHFLEGTRPSKEKDIELSKMQDIYQLGLILYEISHKMKTNMQKR
jgi:serine/threonine protein kinase